LKISSTGTRASEQPSTAAYGCCNGRDALARRQLPKSRGSTAITLRHGATPVVEAVEQRRERAVALVEAQARGVGVTGRARAGISLAWVAIRDLDGLHGRWITARSRRDLPRRSAGSASVIASRGYAFWVTKSDPIVSCWRAIGTTSAQWSAFDEADQRRARDDQVVEDHLLSLRPSMRASLS
jgi:hypothetical protein